MSSITTQKQFDLSFSEAEKTIHVKSNHDLSKNLSGIAYRIADAQLRLNGCYACNLNGVKTLFYV